MKIASLGIWIFVLYIIQNTFCPIIGITDIVPELLFGFALSYATLEHRFNRLSWVIIICAVISGTGIGRSFPIVTLLIGLGGVTAYLSRNYLRFIPQILRTQSITAVFAFLMCTAENFVFTKRLPNNFFVDTALWYVIYTTVLSSIIYLILNRIIFKEKEKKLLIAQERN